MIKITHNYFFNQGGKTVECWGVEIINGAGFVDERKEFFSRKSLEDYLELVRDGRT